MKMTKQLSASISASRRGRFKLTRVKLGVPNLPEAFQGYRFVQLTDLHYGPATRPVIVKEAIELAQSLRPNLFVLTGDYVVAGMTGLHHRFATHVNPKLFGWMSYRRRVRALAQELNGILKHLEAEDGVIGVFGNHDYLEGIGTVKRQLPQSIRWLRNESAIIERGGSKLLVSGVDDLKMGKPDLEKTLQHGKEGFARILLSHNPDIVLKDERNLLNQVDLMLCGHTHGGQIRLPVVGALRTCTKQRDHLFGLSKQGRTLVYTNSGIGCVGIPIRFFCPPEIVEFEFVSE